MASFWSFSRTFNFNYFKMRVADFVSSVKRAFLSPRYFLSRSSATGHRVLEPNLSSGDIPDNSTSKFASPVHHFSIRESDAGDKSTPVKKDMKETHPGMKVFIIHQV